MMKKISFGKIVILGTVFAGIMEIGLAAAQYVRKRVEPDFFMPQGAINRPEKLPMPRYTEGQEVTVKEARPGDVFENEVIDNPDADHADSDMENTPEYKKKYDEYVKDLDNISQTGSIPESQALKEDLGQMDSEARKIVK